MWRLICVFALFAIVAAEQKVPVSVYYESLCPDSIAFITKQLYPAYNSRLKNHMDLKMVPYGKASHQRSTDGQKWEFRCHHGPVECYGNKVQGCVLKQIPNTDDQMKYVNCLMNQAKTQKDEYPLKGCISGADLSTVTACANGTFPETNGADILAANGDETAKLNPPLTFVPTVVFNRVYNKTEQDMSQNNFKRVLCSYLKEECPSECNAANSTNGVISLAALLVPLALLRALL